MCCLKYGIRSQGLGPEREIVDSGILTLCQNSGSALLIGGEVMNGVTRQAVGAKTALCSRDMSCASIQLRKSKVSSGNYVR